MLRQNINSFDLVTRNQFSKVWTLSYPHDDVNDSQKPEDVIPFIKSFQFLITEKNEIPYVQFKFTQNKNVINDANIIDKWTYEHVPGGVVKWITLVKNMKHIDKYIDFELPVCVMYDNPSSMTLKITNDHCLLLLLWDHVTTLNNHVIFNPEVQCVIMMGYSKKKKHHKFIYRYSKHILLLHNKRRILYA